MLDCNTVLVLAPHTDDAELGCGGTLARLAEQGKRVVQVAFSAAETSLPAGFAPDSTRRECAAASDTIGLSPDDCRVLDFEVRRFPERRQDILDQMIQVGRELKPDLVFLPSQNDTHQDHQVIAQEGFRAFKRCSMLGYELPWNTPTFGCTAFVALDERHVQKKIDAMRCYASQAGRAYSSPEFIRSFAHMRGVSIGTHYAECFEVVRWVAN